MIRDKTENLVGDKLHDHAYYQRWDSESTVGLIAVAKPITKAVLSLLCAEIEKMGLSPEEMHGLDVSSDAIGEDFWNEVAQAQLQKILKELGGAE